MTPQQSNIWHTLSASLPEGERVYAVGDIHGCDALLAQIHERMALDRKLRTIRRATLVYLGDYVGSGPASRQVLDRVLATPGWADVVVRLIGDQDALFLDALTSGPSPEDFFKHGGLETLRSYGVTQSATPLRIVAQKALVETARAKVAADHIELLRDGADRFVLGDFFFCHAGVKLGVPLGRQTRADVQAGCGRFLESQADFGAFVVHGHSKTMAPEIRAHRINLHTDPVTSGRLTCGVFEDNRVKFLVASTAGGITEAGARRTLGAG